MLVALTLLFILSGAAGLFYESVWARYLGLFAGHDAYAQVIVLVIFLGGMAIGAMIVGRITDRIREPLFGYAMIEFAIGLVGLFFQDIYVSVTNWAYTTVFPATAGSGMLTVSRWGIAALLILPQSILLGATFPLMTAGALRRIRNAPGRTLAVLYFANSLGAAVGVLIAGFYLVETSGLPGTILAAAILNFIVAIGAMAVMRYAGVSQARQDAAAGDLATEPANRRSTEFSSDTIRRLLLWTALGTAVASFVYEIAWIRMLSLVLSSTTHSFELMLSAFILGLALGSFWVRGRADRFSDPLRTLGIVQLCMGILALATLPIYFHAFSWIGTLLHTFARTGEGYVGYNIARYGICLLVMLPATFCAGITLPLITRTLIQSGVGEKAIGQVYSWNTFGSILGVSLGALVLLPLLGLKALLTTGALLDMAIGVTILLVIATGRPRARRFALAAAGVWAIVALGAGLSPAFDQDLLVSGVYRSGTLPAKGSRAMLYYRDGRTATVSAQKMLQTSEIFIGTNGKTDGSLPTYWLESCDGTQIRHPLRGDAATQAVMALMALAYKPAAEVGAVIGQGTGMSSHILLGNPALRALYTIEIEPEMIRASRAFYPANRRDFDDPRAHYVVDDAKSYFAAAGRRYDFIFSEPSNPWVSGVSGLFTTEFYDRVNQYLKPGGIFAQWIHVYSINDQLVMTVLAALHQKFDHYDILMPAASDMLVIAGNGATGLTPDWSILEYPEIQRDFCHQIPFTAEAMNATWLGDRRTLGPLIGRFPRPNSDFFPHLDNGAERAKYLGEQASGIFGLSHERFDVTAPFIGRRVAPASFTRAPAPEIPRLYNLALGATLRDPAAYLPSDTIPDDDKRSTALYRERVWRLELAGRTAPGDWRVWIQRMADIDHDRYGGTTGYADEAFYAGIGRFLDRTGAPSQVRAVVDFRHGLSGWDFPRAVRAAEPLIAAALDRKSWLPPDELREGAVVARLMTRDTEGARRAFEALAPLTRRPAGDFRTALLSAYIQTAQERAP